MRPKPMTLVILDGWGMRDTKSNNAIHLANTPNYDQWLRECPHAKVETCAEHVGLPDGQMGNSEVGHTNLGAGRIVYQDFTRINLAVKNKTMHTNQALVTVINKAKKNNGAIHLMGLLSPGGVHSHTDHFLAVVEAAHALGVKDIFIHGFLDGRDTPPRSALEYIQNFEAALKKIGAGRIVSLSGRYWVMDRDKRWERVVKAYDMLTQGHGETAQSATEGVQNAYNRDENDEFVLPTVIGDGDAHKTRVKDGDAIIMMNFRADRVREITHAFLGPRQGDGAFTGFERTLLPKLSGYFTLTQYEEGLKGVDIGFPPENLTRILGEEISHAGLKQLRAAETEKYAHVTYFFNGGEEKEFPGEDRLLIQSPKVATYDLQPEMSAQELTDAAIQRIESGHYDLIILNYANPDMVGHTGIMAAALKAIETVDHCLGQLVAAVRKAGGEVLITADHGNADCMLEESTNQPHTAHTNNPAPLIFIGRPGVHITNGALCDVAPSILTLMGLPQPKEMTGKSLVSFTQGLGADLR
ncbi:MAG: 2,3-bisphosphoglycerate-independent phosphoglycerate mutase [Magnetococcales bacterium]|nr:2,3-bisphosphoglycerate-independent phosphoglycerate mutase [Magnetococcales bacterium]